MKELKRLVLWGVLVLIILLTALSAYGAFMGADRARVFFNSVPLAVYWSVFLITLVSGCLLFRRLIRVPSLLLIHTGCMAILVGGLWGSGGGLQLQKAWLGRRIIPQGQMMILNGHTENSVRVGDANDIRTLPFEVTLEQFRIEYYEPGQLYVSAITGNQRWTLPASPGTQFDMGQSYGSMEVVRTFRNFRIAIEESGSKAYDDPGPGSNPAVEIIVTPPGGPSTRRFVFEQHPGHADQGSRLTMQYRRTIRDYISEVKALKDGQVVAKKAIEVNRPLYYGGYHLYQSSYGQDPHTGQMYTVLSVVSDSGLTWVFAGYASLCLGVIWQCGLKCLPVGSKQEAV